MLDVSPPQPQPQGPTGHNVADAKGAVLVREQWTGDAAAMPDTDWR